MAPTSATLSTTLTPLSASKYKPQSTSGSSPDKPPSDRVPTFNAGKSFFDRSTKNPMQERKRLNENYETPVSGREGWWRQEIKETPLPGSYAIDNFIEEIFKKPNTYRFKSDGRKQDPDPFIPKGKLLMPGAYQHNDFIENMRKTKVTYGFKAVPRSARDYMNLGRKDKDVNVCPTTYNVEKHFSMTADKLPSSHWYFRSQANRFPTIYFKPKDGPGPGNYESPQNCVVSLPIDSEGTSSFKSRTPRFKSSHTRVPGPGHYEKTCQAPMPSTVVRMGRQHGVFFSSAFEA